MTRKELTEDLVVSINLALCNKFSSEFRILRPHNIDLIVKQYKQLSDRPNTYRYAYAANAIQRLKPFASNNSRTALALLLTLPNNHKPKIATLAGMLKHGADTEHISSVVEAK